MKGPFSAGDRVKVEWANDGSVLFGNLVPYDFDSGDDLAIQWGNQFVHFWDGRAGTMTYIFALEDVTIEVVAPAGGAG
jgi:hypothetical protein